MSDTILASWANFATKGDPNGLGLTKWPSFDSEEPILDLGPSMQTMTNSQKARFTFFRISGTAASRGSHGGASTRRSQQPPTRPLESRCSEPGRLSIIVRLAQFLLLFSESLRCLPRSRPFAWSIFMLSRVRSRAGSASNSAKVARVLKNILPIGSAGSYRLWPRARVMLGAAR